MKFVNFGARVRFGTRKVYEATWKREFKLQWREEGPPNHLDDKLDSNRQVVNNEISRCQVRYAGVFALLRVRDALWRLSDQHPTDADEQRAHDTGAELFPKVNKLILEASHAFPCQKSRRLKPLARRCAAEH